MLQYGVMAGRSTVLYVCFDIIPSPKGASTHVTYFLRALAERYDVTLLSLGARTTTADYHGVRHVIISAAEENYLDRALAFREAIWDTLEDNTFDIVHYRTMWAALPVAEVKRARAFTTVCEVNGVESIELKYHYPALRGKPQLLTKLRDQEALAFSIADAIITPAEVTRNYLLHHAVPDERITVIPNGVDLELFRPAETSCHNSPLTVLYTGTLAPWQGLDILIDAVHRIIDRCPLRLRILGAGAHRWQRLLDKQIAKYRLEPHVEFLPPVPHEQVPAVICAADICVAPLAPTERNLVQGCSPLKLFEYLACGKPVVAGNLPVAREIVTHEEDALLFKVSKPARLAECLLRLAEDAPLRRRLGEQARTRAKTFSWERAQEGLLQVYANIIPASR